MMGGATFSWWRDNQAILRPYSAHRYVRDISPYFDSLSDKECIDLYRLDKHGINYFSDRLSNHELIHRSTKAGLPANVQFSVALRYFATGNSIHSLKDTAGLNLSHGSVENCIKNVSSALCGVAKQDVSFPFNAASISCIKQGFAEYAGFPSCIGAIDGTQIKIKAPSVDEDAFIGKKEGHHINCQVVCDHNLKFIDAVVRWPGSVNDSTIWKLCSFRKQLNAYISTMPTSYKAWLIGDSGYAQGANLMTPVIETDTTTTSAAETSYNVSHKKARCKVERSIGILKSRFRCLCKKTGGGIQFNDDTCCKIVMSCIILHNYCRDRNFPFDVAPDIKQLIEEERFWQTRVATKTPAVISEGQETVRGIKVRRALIADNFN